MSVVRFVHQLLKGKTFYCDMLLYGSVVRGSLLKGYNATGHSYVPSKNDRDFRAPGPQNPMQNKVNWPQPEFDRVSRQFDKLSLTCCQGLMLHDWSLRRLLWFGLAARPR